MSQKTRGAILVTTLIILLIMTTLTIQIYQSLILMEKAMTAHWQGELKSEALRTKALEIINQDRWSASCFTARNTKGKACTSGHYHYIIEQINLSVCSVVLTQGQWYDALLYHFWVWHEDEPMAYFARVAKADSHLTCKTPENRFRTMIQSELDHIPIA